MRLARLQEIERYQTKPKILRVFQKFHSDKEKYPISSRGKVMKRKIPSIIGWLLLTIGSIGLVWSLIDCVPILDNLYQWGINSAICIALIWLGWGFAHYSLQSIWSYYISQTLKTLLETICIVAILYASYRLIGQSITLEMGIAIAVSATIILVCLQWMARHKVIGALLELLVATGICVTIFPNQVAQLTELLKIYIAMQAVFAYFNPLYMIYIIGGIALIAWLIVGMMRK